MTHTAMNSLLKLLKTKKVVQSRLPKDYRTLLRTPHRTCASFITIEGGQMWYHGIKQCLQHYFSDVKPSLESLWIDISMDGLSLHRSGPTQLWPILMRLCEVQEAPIFVVAIFCGSSKPQNAEQYLRQFVTEINELQSNGIVLQGVTHQVKLRAIIADSPARALIKGVVSFNGCHGCLKCTDIPVHDTATKRMYFAGVGIEKRTDAKFRAQEYPQHCKKPTPLIDILYFDIIADVIIADRLHLIDLGVMRKLLNGWIKGKFTKGPHHTKWTSRQCDIISEFLLHIKLPSEIHRSPRSLQYIKFWKGTEFRTFLHYASVVVLKEILPETAYNHFLLLFCATTFLSTTVILEPFMDLAEFQATFIIFSMFTTKLPDSDH
ncbi:uncharacterized protein LOC125769488 [Anopheles funestus]|uniref:uncharacterized protein LOC125769488 n=1 Tax=Anopheles funestus TaxID=62324 RepID=UPI0020C61BA3|nr:uncharacterized protein LOC125769488 [Anopheles funestus]